MARRDDEELSGIDVDAPPSLNEEDQTRYSLSDPMSDELEDTGAEYDASEEIASELNNLNNETQTPEQALAFRPPVPVAQSDDELEPMPSHPADKYQRYMDEYKRLQEQRQKNLDRSAYLKALNTIGQSVAGRHSGNFKTDDSGVELLQQLANRPVQDFEDRQKVDKLQRGLSDEATLRDPGSNISKFYREMANQRKLTGVTDDMSAWDIANMQKLGGRSALTKPQQSQYLNRETGNPVIFDQEHNRYVDSVSNEPVQSFVRNVAYRNAFGDQVYAGGPGQTPAMAISSQYRPIEAMSDKEIERFQPKKEQRASLEKEQNSLNKQNEIAQKQYTAISKLRQVINSKNKLTGAVIRTQMPRLSGEVGNLNESEQQVWTGSQALLDRVGQWLLRQGESELTETNRKELSDLIDTFEGSIQEATKQAKGRSQQSLAVNYAIPKPFSDRALTIPTALPHSEAQKKQLREKKSGKVVPIKADKYDAALKSGLFEEVQ